MEKRHLNNFIEYFSKKLSLNDLNKLNTQNKINTDRVDLYHDFIISLVYIIDETYLGDDFIKSEDDVKSHFKWCWLKNIDNFKKENILFCESGSHYHYYFDYFYRIYYKSDKHNNLIDDIIEFWDSIFGLNKVKTMSQYDIFIEIYEICNKYFINRLDIII